MEAPRDRCSLHGLALSDEGRCLRCEPSEPAPRRPWWLLLTPLLGILGLLAAHFARQQPQLAAPAALSLEEPQGAQPEDAPAPEPEPAAARPRAEPPKMADADDTTAESPALEVVYEAGEIDVEERREDVAVTAQPQHIVFYVQTAPPPGGLQHSPPTTLPPGGLGGHRILIPPAPRRPRYPGGHAGELTGKTPRHPPSASTGRYRGGGRFGISAAKRRARAMRARRGTTAERRKRKRRRVRPR